MDLLPFFGKKMRTNLQIVNLEDDSVHLSEIKDTEITELFDLQDTLVLAVLESFKLEEDEIRVSNDDIKTIEELRLLQFAAKEREKWSRASYPAYEEAINKLYSIKKRSIDLQVKLLVLLQIDVVGKLFILDL